MTEKGQQFTKFASELWDGFETLCKHTGNEIKFLQGALEFFKKRVKIEEEYAKALGKLADKKQYATSKGTLAQAWDSTLFHTQNTSTLHSGLVSQLNEKVIESIQGLIKDMENTRKQLMNEGYKLNEDYGNHVKELEKTKQGYEKLSKEAEIAQKTYDATKAEGKSKDLLKIMEKEVSKRHQQAAAADEIYKKKVEETNNFLDQYYTDLMPKILSEFEHLETVRIHMLKVHLKKFINIIETAPPQIISTAKALMDVVDKINVDSDLDGFIAANKTDKTIPEPFEYQSYKEGNVQPKRPLFNKRKSLKTVAVAPPPTLVFGVSLEKLMEKQKEKYPELEIPRILPTLVDAIFKLDGPKNEGIFRVPANSTELKIVKEKIDQGDYDILTHTDNVHIPCGLLKLWLRDLPDPLITANFYETCVENPEIWKDVLTKLPPVNQRVVVHVVNFLQQLNKPEYIEITKMDLDNLAMVFAPSFLRCPYQDYNKALGAADKEKAFLLKLLEGIQPAFSEDIHVPLSPRPSSSELQQPSLLHVPSETNSSEETKVKFQIPEEPKPVIEVSEPAPETIKRPISPVSSTSPRPRPMPQPPPKPTVTGNPTSPILGKVSVLPAKSTSTPSVPPIRSSRPSSSRIGLPPLPIAPQKNADDEKNL